MIKDEVIINDYGPMHGKQAVINNVKDYVVYDGMYKILKVTTEHGKYYQFDHVIKWEIEKKPYLKYSYNEIVHDNITIIVTYRDDNQTYYPFIATIDPLPIQNVIFNDPATIVFWSDNTKTVVKCGESDTFDPEKGLAMAITKKFLGNSGKYFDEIKKWTEPYYYNNKSEELFANFREFLIKTVKKEKENEKD